LLLLVADRYAVASRTATRKIVFDDDAGFHLLRPIVTPTPALGVTRGQGRKWSRGRAVNQARAIQRRTLRLVPDITES
jgi:hypothetical protein